MYDTILVLLVGGGVSLLTAVIPILLNLSKARTEMERTRAESDRIDIDTIITLKKQVIELIQEGDDMRKRLNHLEKEHKRYVNAYARALRHIYDTNPNIELPNFLEDTDPLIKLKK